MPISATQHSDSVIHIHTYTYTPFQYYMDVLKLENILCILNGLCTPMYMIH